MSHNPITSLDNQLAVDAAEEMDQRKVNQIIVVDQNKKIVGALNTHDLMQAKVI